MNSNYVDMKITVVLETRREKANGKYPVKIRFNFHRQAFYVSTGVEVPKENFISGKIVGVPRAVILNNVVADKLTYTQNVLEDLQSRGLLRTKFQTGTELKRFIESGDEGYEELDKDERIKLHFSTYTNNYAAKFRSVSSRSQYTQMLVKVGAFVNLETFYITDITVGFLKDFDVYCESTGMSVNGRGVYMRAIRTIFNDAIDHDLIGYDVYPFRRFKIKRSKTKHRNVTIKDLQYMYNLDMDVFKAELKEMSKKHTSEFPDVRKYIDLFFLSFFLCGMNVKDILFLTRADIRNDQLSIMRDKTNEPVIIRIEPEAMDIIKRYPGKKYLLSFLDTYTTDDYRNLQRRMNDNLKLVLSFVSCYWARHSWATIAGELDVPDPIIDLAQGRTTPGMAGIYTNRNTKVNINKVSEANRKVIDFLINKKPTKNK